MSQLINQEIYACRLDVLYQSVKESPPDYHSLGVQFHWIVSMLSKALSQVETKIKMAAINVTTICFQSNVNNSWVRKAGKANWFSSRNLILPKVSRNLCHTHCSLDLLHIYHNTPCLGHIESFTN